MKYQGEYKIKEVQLEGILMMIEGMLLYALDKADISTKWHNRKKNAPMVAHKLQQVREVKDWVDSDNWHIWLNIYCRETGVNEKAIRINYKKIVKDSLSYITRLKHKHPELT